MLRLVTGELYGESTSPIDELTIDDGEVSFSGEFSGSTVAQGRFIEIVSPGSNPEEAENRAHSMIGLAGAIFGPQAFGEQIFSEPFEAEIGHQYGKFRIPVNAQNPRSLNDAEIDIAHDALNRVLNQDTRMNRAVSLALIWYEKGTRSNSFFDKFLGLFIGIETLINAYVSEHGPVTVAEERANRFDEIVKELKGRFSQDDLSRLKQRLTGTSFSERVAHYADEQGWDDSFTCEIRELAKKRNLAVHGESIGIDQSDVTKAQDNLIRLIRATIDVKEKFDWESQLQILGLEVTWQYQTSH